MNATMTVTILQIFAFATFAALGTLALRRALTPKCPRCRARKWDRKLCQPLLFCRVCATRCDSSLRVYN
jgi:hypothetical protein